MNPATKVTSVSAPGKVLLAGGYLVLERPNSAVVLATTSRFHSTICYRAPWTSSIEKETPPSSFSHNDATVEILPIDVYSPQFHATFLYWLVVHNNNNTQDHQPFLTLFPRIPTQTPNPFIEKTLLVTLAFVLHFIGRDKFIHHFQYFNNTHAETQQALAIQLRADNDFYSQIHYLETHHMDLTLRNIESLPPFLPCPCQVGEDHISRTVVHKTGLGSSAALVTSLVSSILVFFDIVQLPQSFKSSSSMEEKRNAESRDLQLCHNVAQLCHSLAQGKIGSGFDVSAAIYGSHIYTRFSEDVILTVMDLILQDTLGDNETRGSMSISTSTVQAVHECIMYGKWDSVVEPYQLPKDMELLLADVCGGSESPSMARKVLAWKKQRLKIMQDDAATGDAADPWDALCRTNKVLRHLFLSAYAQSEESSSARSENDDSDSNIRQQYAQTVQDISKYLMESRKHLKRMGILAGVEIEPDFQTRLANDCMKLGGVIVAGVPGAGGNDALFVLYDRDHSSRGDEEKKDVVRENIVNFWSQWCTEYEQGCAHNDDDVVRLCPLTSKSSGCGTMNGVCQTNLTW